MPKGWDNPHDWFVDYIHTRCENVKVEAILLSMELDSAALQDVYQAEMEEDGYFNVEEDE